MIYNIEEYPDGSITLQCHEADSPVIIREYQTLPSDRPYFAPLVNKQLTEGVEFVISIPMMCEDGRQYAIPTEPIKQDEWEEGNKRCWLEVISKVQEWMNSPVQHKLPTDVEKEIEALISNLKTSYKITKR